MQKFWQKPIMLLNRCESLAVSAVKNHNFDYIRAVKGQHLSTAEISTVREMVADFCAAHKIVLRSAGAYKHGDWQEYD